MKKMNSQQLDFGLLFRESPARILVVEPEDFRIVEVTDAYLNATMRDRQSLIGKTLFEAFPDKPGDKDADGTRNLRASLERCVETGQPDEMPIQRYPIERPASEGGGFEERYWQVHNRPLLPDYVLHCVEDITDQVVSQQAAEKSDILMEMAGEAAKLGWWRYSLQPEQLYWSPQTKAIHEVDGDKVPVVSDAIKFYAPEYREVIKESFQRCLEDYQTFDVITQLVTAKGNRVWVRSIGQPEFDQEGKLIGAIGAFQDVTDLVKAEQLAEDISGHLGETLESISDAFFLLDDQWNFTFLNSQAEKVLHRSKSELLNQNVWDEFPEAVGSLFQTEYEKAVQTRTTSRFIEYYPPLDTWFQVSAYPTERGLCVYFRDINEEQKRNAQLRLLGTTVEHLNDLLIITEANSLNEPEGPRIVYVNRAFTERTGYSADEIIGMTPRVLQGKQTDRAVLKRIREALEKRSGVRAELINYTKQGKPYWIELEVTPLRDRDGVLTHYIGISRDITEKKHAEDRFKLIARATNDIIWDWDLTTNKVWWNESFSDVFGYSENEIGEGPESWSDRIHPEDRDAVLESIERVIAGELDSWSYEYRFVDAHGKPISVIDRAYVLRDEAGNATRLIGSMLDVTERRAIEEQLRQSQKMEAVGQLTGGVAHDFNNLLTVILGNAELLYELADSNSYMRELAEMTVSAAERGAELTNRLLAFARRQPLEPEALELNQLLLGMRSLLKRSLSESMVLQLELSDDLWTVEVDPGQLESAVLNLTINARDAMPQGGKLVIETLNSELDEVYCEAHDDLVSGDYVMLSVSDSGTGMSEDIQRKVFDPFFTTKDKGKGSGLGLSMVYGFIKQSGGHIKIYSEPNQGTTIKLYLPRIKTIPAMEEAETKRTAEPGSNQRILVVEDDSLVRKHVTSQLNGLGYRVTEAENADEAMRILKSGEPFDLLFTDVVMPGSMNGPELVAKAQQLFPELKVLFTSGYTENAIVHHGRLDKGVELLSKPYKRQDLAEKVYQILS